MAGRYNRDQGQESQSFHVISPRPGHRGCKVRWRQVQGCIREGRKPYGAGAAEPLRAVLPWAAASSPPWPVAAQVRRGTQWLRLTRPPRAPTSWRPPRMPVAAPRSSRLRPGPTGHALPAMVEAKDPPRDRTLARSGTPAIGPAVVFVDGDELPLRLASVCAGRTSGTVATRRSSRSRSAVSMTAPTARTTTVSTMERKRRTDDCRCRAATRFAPGVGGGAEPTTMGARSGSRCRVGWTPLASVASGAATVCRGRRSTPWSRSGVPAEVASLPWPDACDTPIGFSSEPPGPRSRSGVALQGRNSGASVAPAS